MRLIKRRNPLKDQRILLSLVIVLIVIVVSFIKPAFLKINNIFSILQQISVLGVLTMAMGLLLLSGGIDLSMGNMMALACVTMATIINTYPDLPYVFPLALVTGLLMATAAGTLNGIIIAKSKCMPLIITLGTSQMFYGIGLLIAGGSFQSFFKYFDFLRKVKLFNVVPLMVLLMLLVVVVVYVLVARTRFGRRVIAIGGNEKNAFLSGINVDLHKIRTYGLSGLLVGVASCILAGRLNSITATAGQGYELDALVAAIIGGITFEGGRGSVGGAFLGCLFTGIIANALDIMGVHSYTKTVITGALIIVAVILSNLNNLKKKK
ncbi:MAG: ABC transporter permease [Clostridiales bacterium]|nr:ABC transporter permease [Clostridiales bacterium]